MDLPKLDIGKLENISDSSFTDTLKDDFDTINDTLNLTENGIHEDPVREGHVSVLSRPEEKGTSRSKPFRKGEPVCLG